MASDTELSVCKVLYTLGAAPPQFLVMATKSCTKTKNSDLWLVAHELPLVLANR